MPKVSIITASYNYEKYIRETIESVMSQTFQDWEMIIIDDGSTDNSVEVIKEYCARDSRIKLFQHEGGVNKGLSETVQLGLKHATSEWVAFLESDDTITPNYLEEKLKIIEEYPNVEFIFNDVNMFGEEEVLSASQAYFLKQKRILSEYEYPTNLLKAFRSTHTNLIPTFSCVMLKKECLQSIDYKAPVKGMLDAYLWLQIIPKVSSYYVNKKLTNWRMHKNSYINRDELKFLDSFCFEFKRIYFLFGKFAFLKYIFLIINFARKSLIRVHIKEDKKEILLLGAKIRLAGQKLEHARRLKSW